MLRIRIADPAHSLYYRATVSPIWARRHDNGHMISCGLSCPDDLSTRSLQALVRRGQAVPISHDEWNHSGCQSRCIRRGDALCQW